MKSLISLVLLMLLLGAVFPIAAQDDIPFEPFVDENYKIQGYLPAGWADVGGGIYLRQADPDDPVLIALQSGQVSPDEMWAALLPQFQLTEVPEVVESYATDVLAWDIYQFEVTVPQGILKFDLALAASGNMTYLALLQAPTDQFDALHESIFIPILDGFAPLTVADMNADLPYIAEEVTFQNGDVTLAGTLTIPEGEGPFPAVVLVSGSGSQDRDESLFPIAEIKPFRLVADYLTQHGIVVLRYDDQGVGGSTGDIDATIEENTQNAAAAIDYLLTRPEVNPDALGLIGHSEGGVAASILGATDPDLDFIVLMAGMTVDAVDLLVKQNERLMLAEGMTQAQVDDQVAFVIEFFEVFLAGDTEAARALMLEQVLQQFSEMPEDQRNALGDLDVAAEQTVEQNMAQYESRWLYSLLDFDPTLYWPDVTIPVLAIFGGLDVQVDAEQNAGALETMLQASGHEDYTIIMIENANHLFQPAQTGGLSEYSTLPQEFVPDLLPTMTDWILERAN